MCGIAGIFDPEATGTLSLPALQRMLLSQAHRGPDEAGMYLDDQAGLAHVRLSIIGLKGGAQPIANADRTRWIVFNGEIFNYVELKREREAEGYRFTTATDTEVILAQYDKKGPDCVRDFNGQFAFAIWDARRGELFLARDRVGIRPLHYARVGSAFVFASEVKALFASGAVRPELDRDGLDQVFTLWTPLPGRTVFQGVEEVPPGHWMQVSARGERLTRYWDFPFLPPGEQTADRGEALLGAISETLEDAVRLRLRADVPVGAYLSGGLDSAGLTAIVATRFNSDLRTYGLRFEEAAFDEGTYQRLMVDHLGTRHQEAPVSNRQIAERFPEVVWHGEKPLLRTAPTPMYLLAEKVRADGLKVVLTGEGADEVFGGYNIFREALIRRFWARRPESRLRPRLLARLYPYVFRDPRLARTLTTFFGQGLDQGADPLFSHLIRWRNTSRIKAFYSADMRQWDRSEQHFDALRDALPARFGDLEPLARAQYLEMRLFLSNYLLSSQGDRMAMAHGVEIRVPYLDHRLIELLGAVPGRLKIRGLDEKHLLKQVLRPLLPEPVWRRDKHPFRAPIAPSLLAPDGPPWVRECLSPVALAETGLFDPDKTGRLVRKLSETEKGSETDAMALVGIVSTQLLVRQVAGGAAPERLGPPQSAHWGETLLHDHRQGRPATAGASGGRRPADALEGRPTW